MPNIDARTQRGWPLPHPDNAPLDDVQRISASFTAIDSAVTNVESDFAGLKRYIASIDITIPTTGWALNENDASGYPYYVDVANNAILATMTPVVTVSRGDHVTACEAGLCPVVDTLDGALRVYSRAVPDTAITASLALFDVLRQSAGNSEEPTEPPTEGTGE